MLLPCTAFTRAATYSKHGSQLSGWPRERKKRKESLASSCDSVLFLSVSVSIRDKTEVLQKGGRSSYDWDIIVRATAVEHTNSAKGGLLAAILLKIDKQARLSSLGVLNRRLNTRRNGDPVNGRPEIT